MPRKEVKLISFRLTQDEVEVLERMKWQREEVIKTRLSYSAFFRWLMVDADSQEHLKTTNEHRFTA